MPSPRTSPTAKQQPQALISHFIACYESKYGRVITVNRYRDKWGFQDMIDSVGYERSKELIEYYFSTDQAHTMNKLFNTFDALDESMRKRDADRVYRARLLEETKKRMESE